MSAVATIVKHTPGEAIQITVTNYAFAVVDPVALSQSNQLRTLWGEGSKMFARHAKRSSLCCGFLVVVFGRMSVDGCGHWHYHSIAQHST